MPAKYWIGWNGSVRGAAAAGVAVTITINGTYQLVESNVIVAAVVAVAGVKRTSPPPETSVCPSVQMVMTTFWPTSGCSVSRTE